MVSYITSIVTVVDVVLVVVFDFGIAKVVFVYLNYLTTEAMVAVGLVRIYLNYFSIIISILDEIIKTI